MPNNMNKYGFGNNQDTDNRDWYPTKQEPIKAKLYPYNHIDDLINEKLEQHIQRTDNPHQVTLQQLGVDHLFTHNMRVEYDEDKPIIHLILLDLNGNPLSDVGPIDIDVSEYSEEQLEELKRYLEEKINVVEEEVKEIIDNLSIEELSKRTYTDDKYILAHEYNKDVTYYEKVLDVNPNILRGMWKFKDTLNLDDMLFDTGAVFLNMYYYFYDNNGQEIRDPNYGNEHYTPGSRISIDINSQNENIALGRGSKHGGWSQINFYYKENSYWTYDYFKLIYIEKGDDRAINWLIKNAEKLSDTLLPYNNYDYKTKYVEVPITEEDFEPDKYYYLESTEHTVVRIQLDPKESIYRDYDGNDVVKIVDNNVLLNGEPLSPNLTVNSDTIINKVLETNAEEVYDNKLNGLNLTIPSSAKHGFCSYISFEPASTFTFNVFNESEYSLKVIMNGAKTALSDIQFIDNCQYNLMFLCNGVNVELYIQEIQLD